MDKPINAVIAHLWNIYALNDYNIMEAVKADPLAIQQICGDAAETIEHLCNTRTAPANPPLTLDELREMDGEPTYIVNLETNDQDGWAIVDTANGRRSRGVLLHNKAPNDYGAYELYGVTWLAYRHKPEREDDRE